MARPPLTTDNFYHIYNRGVEKRDVFLDQHDYSRFVHGLFEFNDENASPNIFRRFPAYHPHNEGNPTSLTPAKKMLVDIVCFCLMPNHFHLLVRQRTDHGVSKFMQKLGVGYTNYFNTRYERSGVLFQGKFKSVPVERDTYLTHLSRYIHLNPVDLIEPKWKENGIGNWQIVKKHLLSYPWSSYSDYTGAPRFASTIRKDFLMEYFNNDNAAYEAFVEMHALKDLESIKDLAME